MLARGRLFLFVAACGALAGGPAAAAPVTWHSSGQITNVVDAGGVLPGISVGIPWTLDITFEPGTQGVRSSACTSATYRYAGAVSSARLLVGGFSYTNVGGDVFTNADLPVIGCSTPLGGQGLVQFQWLGGWTGGIGSPDLNVGLGLLLASYNDVNAVNGSLPSAPSRNAVQGPLAGLQWNFSVGAGPEFSSTFDPRLASGPAPLPVPEPGSWILLTTGLAAVVAGRRRRRTTI